MNRGRIRVGRSVNYYPTSAEATTYGAGPHKATITKVRSDNTVDITIEWPRPIAGYGTQDATFGAPELAALADVTTSAKKESVKVGGAAGQVSLFGP